MKTPGTDNINAELLQAAGPQVTQRIQELILNIWRYERTPNEWNKSIICPIRTERNLNVPIIEESHSLILHIRCLASLINNRLKIYAEDLLSQEQNGFRRNRSTKDNICIRPQIRVLEKCYEYNIEMHV